MGKGGSSAAGSSMPAPYSTDVERRASYLMLQLGFGTLANLIQNEGMPAESLAPGVQLDSLNIIVPRPNQTPFTSELPVILMTMFMFIWLICAFYW